jgi:hypothetical protein
MSSLEYQLLLPTVRFFAFSTMVSSHPPSDDNQSNGQFIQSYSHSISNIKFFLEVLNQLLALSVSEQRRVLRQFRSQRAPSSDGVSVSDRGETDGGTSGSTTLGSNGRARAVALAKVNVKVNLGTLDQTRTPTGQSGIDVTPRNTSSSRCHGSSVSSGSSSRQVSPPQPVRDQHGHQEVNSPRPVRDQQRSGDGAPTHQPETPASASPCMSSSDVQRML